MAERGADGRFVKASAAVASVPAQVPVKPSRTGRPARSRRVAPVPVRPENAAALASVVKHGMTCFVALVLGLVVVACLVGRSPSVVSVPVGTPVPPTSSPSW